MAENPLMTTRRALFVLSCLLLVAPLGKSQTPRKRQTTQQSLPLAFEQNDGQVPRLYRYVAHHNSMETLYSSDGMDILAPRSRSAMTRLHLHWVGGNPKASIEGEDPQAGKSNYIHGRDRSRWIRGAFRSLRVFGMYRSIRASTLFFTEGATSWRMTSSCREAPIRPGCATLRSSLARDRYWRPGSGSWRIKSLLSEACRIQEIANLRKQVSVRFAPAKNGRIGFELGAYSHNRALVIDPVFGFSTYLAGTGTDQTAAVTTDAAGNVYLTGNTNSVDFPIMNAEQAACVSCTDTSSDPDVFVSELDPTGHTLLFSTYIGGSRSDLGEAVSIDRSGNIIVAGVSASSDFPLKGAIPSLACQINDKCFFVLSLKPNGSALNYSGLVGGIDGTTPNSFFTGSYALTSDVVLAVNAAGNTYIGGETDDVHFQLTPGTLSPTVPGYPYNSGFVMKFDPTGLLIYSTIIPGKATPNPGDPFANEFPPGGIAVDAKGQVTLAGTGGIGLPATVGALQPTVPASNLTTDSRVAGYALQLNATGSALNYATYVAGTDYIGGLAVNASGDLYLTGYTGESNLPVSANAYQGVVPTGRNCPCNQGFVLEMNGQGSSILAATYLAGAPIVQGIGTLLTSIALDSNSNVLVGGNTFSVGFPLKNPFVSEVEFSTFSESLIVTELNPNLSVLMFSSYLSSTSGSLPGSQFTGLTVNAQNNVIVIGNTFSSSFPTAVNSFQPSLLPPTNPLVTRGHGFISKLNLTVAAPSVCLSTWSVNFGSAPVGTSLSQSVNLENCGNAPLHLASVVSSVSAITVNQNCGVVAPGALCPIQLTFTPTNGAPVMATITLNDDAVISPQVFVAGAGVGAGGSGTSGLAGFSANSLTFNGQVVGTSSAAQVVTITSLGMNALVVSGVTVSGDFSQSNNCGTVVPHLSCAISVVFAPNAAGARTGTLTISDNDPSLSQSVSLSGTGSDMGSVPRQIPARLPL